MMSAQTKLSVDTAKEVQADASLKTKVTEIITRSCLLDFQHTLLPGIKDTFVILCQLP